MLYYINKFSEKAAVAWRSYGAAQKLAAVVVLVLYLAVLLAGLSATEPIVADEVVHYYMLVTQAEKLPSPNVDVNIPMAKWTFHRFYPHVFLWHYLGAIVWKLSGGSFRAVQVYHSLYWLQLLIAFWALAKSLMPKSPWSVLVAVLGLATLPMGMLLSVLLYQDIPAVANIVTSFFFLQKRKFWLSHIFMGIALSLKITVFVLLPAYFLCVLFLYLRSEPAWKSVSRMLISLMVISLLCVPMAVALKKCGFSYYPVAAVEQYLSKLGFKRNSVEFNGEQARAAQVPQQAGAVEVPSIPDMSVNRVDPEPVRPEICNHPGDLRIPANWIVYFGGVWWILILSGVAGMVRLLSYDRHNISVEWPLAVGLWAVFAIAFHMRAAPDARFFLPAVPFLLVGLRPPVERMKWRGFWICCLLFICILQSGAVLGKVVRLRSLSPGMKEAIDHEKESRHGVVNYFMYPEGHERYLPGVVDWYIGFELRDFWRGNNDERIRLLKKYGLNVVVIKKARVRDVDAYTIDLGLYPASFVRDIEEDSRFVKSFENDSVIIYDLSINEQSSD